MIILNGGSSSGKTTLAKCLQNTLPTPWLRFSIDDLVDAMPDAMFSSNSGIQFGEDGSVSPGTEFRTLETAWMQGIGEMARRGASVIVDDVFLRGVESCNRWKANLEGLQVLWVGVYCDPVVASARERERGDRNEGMAASQATIVHEGMHYDLKVDTTKASTEECVRMIIEKIIL
ncbi:chloramphenicol phosphotransferase [Falsibacillus albus]|uniref:Chloramphenicol phosphotransferase n=1 Tax=Falsibacillus albus TaxID=2478915 RepID=A0A3L7JS61_9BACI|nr:chloramphenicol phosphotransferase [Falsibacillus albus]